MYMQKWHLRYKTNDISQAKHRAKVTAVSIKTRVQPMN